MRPAIWLMPAENFPNQTHGLELEDLPGPGARHLSGAKIQKQIRGKPAAGRIHTEVSVGLDQARVEDVARVNNNTVWSVFDLGD